MAHTPSTHLVFSRSPHAGGPVHLVFGATAEPPTVALATGALLASFPPSVPTASGSGVVVVLGSLQTAAPAAPQPTASASAQYLSLTERPTVSRASVLHQAASSQAAGARARHQDASASPAGARARHQDATASATPVRHVLPGLIAPLYAPTAARHQNAAGLQNTAALRHQDGTPAVAKAQPQHQDAAPVQGTAAMPHQDGTPVWRWVNTRHTEAQRISLHRRASHQPGTERHRLWHARHQDARTPPPGRSVRPVPPVTPPRVPNAHLVFACPPWAGGAVHLVFGRVCGIPAFISVPVRKAYIVINSIDLRRVAGNISLPAHTFRMSLDADSWTWSWSATLDRAAESLLHPIAGQPVELEATVNGVPYRLLVGSVGRQTTFPQRRITVQGRGLASVLAAPNAPVLSHLTAADMTAQQLMHQVLTVNGASIGWDIDFGLDDWLVPAGAWSMRATPIDALVDIAGAVGGYIQPHPTAATVRVLRRYPVAPWDWGDTVPDVALPQDVTEVENMDWVDKPAYNRVFVGGVGAGVFGPVTRAGTAGDTLAPQVNHALITDAVAHRQRGLAVLADTGRQIHMSLKLPVLPETGLILPGKMVRYVADQTRVGIVRSVSLDWSNPVMRQTIGVECHAA